MGPLWSRIGAVLVAPARLTGAAAGSFHPRSMPILARRSYAVELWTTLFFSVTLASIEGGVIGVYTKQSFSDVTSPGRLNLVVALIGAAPETANLLSFVWAVLSTGRAKVPFINALQLAVVALVGTIALVPRTSGGLYSLLFIVIAARVCWSGIITLRPTIWRANYARRDRARIVGKFSTVQQLMVAFVGLGLGAALDRWSRHASVLMTFAALVGVVAVWATGKQRARGGPAAQRAEAVNGPAMKPWHGPLIVWNVLRKDARYSQFMLAMFVLGFGNLMVTPMLVIILKEQFQLGYLGSITIISALPSLIVPVAIPMWSRMLDRAHVVRFRSVHGWTFLAATLVFALAVLTRRLEWMYLGAVIQGVAIGGGALAWNLGHVDFAPTTDASRYMATHVTLNGLRGLAAPLVAVGVYEFLARHGWSHSGAAGFVLGTSAALCLLGTAGFVALRRSMGSTATRPVRE